MWPEIISPKVMTALWWQPLKLDPPLWRAPPVTLSGPTTAAGLFFALPSLAPASGPGELRGWRGHCCHLPLNLPDPTCRTWNPALAALWWRPSIERQKCLRFVLDLSSVMVPVSGRDLSGPFAFSSVFQRSARVGKSFRFHKSKTNRDNMATAPHWLTAALEGKQWLSLISYKSLAACQVQRPHNPLSR